MLISWTAMSPGDKKFNLVDLGSDTFNTTSVILDLWIIHGRFQTNQSPDIHRTGVHQFLNSRYL